VNRAQAKREAPEGCVQWIESRAGHDSEPHGGVIERVGLWTCDVRVTYSPGRDAEVGQVVRVPIRRLKPYVERGAEDGRIPTPQS
jgi:hypothetical protein